MKILVVTACQICLHSIIPIYHKLPPLSVWGHSHGEFLKIQQNHLRLFKSEIVHLGKRPEFHEFDKCDVGKVYFG